MSFRRNPRPRVRRRYPRLTVRVDVRLEMPGEVIEAVATTLGAGGLFVATDRRLPRGTLMGVRFRMPGDDRLLELDARVAWGSSPSTQDASAGIGIEFVDKVARTELATLLEEWAQQRRESLVSGARQA
ncbi:MAG: PilZ domain-containing protein [Myxococcota bacterium]